MDRCLQDGRARERRREGGREGGMEGGKEGRKGKDKRRKDVERIE